MRITINKTILKSGFYIKNVDFLDSLINIPVVAPSPANAFLRSQEGFIIEKTLVDKKKKEDCNGPKTKKRLLQFRQLFFRIFNFFLFYNTNVLK